MAKGDSLDTAARDLKVGRAAALLVKAVGHAMQSKYLQLYAHVLPNTSCCCLTVRVVSAERRQQELQGCQGRSRQCLQRCPCQGPLMQRFQGILKQLSPTPASSALMTTMNGPERSVATAVAVLSFVDFGSKLNFPQRICCSALRSTGQLY